MQVMGLGIDYASGDPLVNPRTENEFAKQLLLSLDNSIDAIRTLARAGTAGTAYKGEIERTHTPDLGDPRAVGWTYLINADDPQRTELEAAIEPLAVHRGMDDLSSPLLYHNEEPDEWLAWLEENYFSASLEGKQPPFYVLIVGSPEQVPFKFQSILGSAAAVGRVDFDSLADLRTYVDKLIRLETIQSPIVSRKTIFFAPDPGPHDPTYFSRRYMVEPLLEHVRNELSFDTEYLVAASATKTNFLHLLSQSNPTLVYTASHGLGATNQSLTIQKRYNGAICCEASPGTPILDRSVTADDIPLDQPFLEGAIWFQFACFGYGTPDESDYSHWKVGIPNFRNDSPFIAALPKKLLAHPHGPIAYIGHVDMAFLHAFADPENPLIPERWHPRVYPFVRAVDTLLAAQPSGLSMVDLKKRYDICNANIMMTYDRDKRGKVKWTAELESRFVSNWITRSDAENYMIFGDSAARIRIPEG